MSKAILICGKICSGKSYYAEKLRKENKAVLLSLDEITLLLKDGCPKEILPGAKELLFKKSLEILETGTDVILEWGFWKKEERDRAREFYESKGIHCEMHYVEISEEMRKFNLAERNRLVEEGKVRAYHFNDERAEMFDKEFEEPCISEIDVWTVNERTLQ